MNLLKSWCARPRLFAVALIFGGMAVVPALAVMVIVPVTPDTADRGGYSFSVSTNVEADGVSIHIDIRMRQTSASTRASAGLYLKQGVGRGRNVTYGDRQPNGQPMPPVTLTQRDRVWEADFVASSQLLQSTNLYFNFVVQPNVVGVNGQRTLVPGGWIYELNLREFLKP